MKIYRLLVALLLSSCAKKEDVLISSENVEDTYILPQGNHDYDPYIQRYYDQYGSFLLYKFSKRDAFWSVTTAIESYKLLEADENFVGPQLELLQQSFFRFYEESTLKKFLPIKVLLCSSLTIGTATQQIDALFLGPTNIVAGYQTFAVNWGNDRVDNMTVQQKNTFKGNVNYSFLRMMDLSGKMSKSDSFKNTSDYITPLTQATIAERNVRGFLVTGAIPGTTTDWNSYLSVIVNNSYETLIDPNVSVKDVTSRGILSPIKDRDGLIRKKYQLMIDHYKQNYQIDLQRIGNSEINVTN